MSLAKLRHQEHYQAVTRELRSAGLSWREEFGGKHARLIIDVNGREEVEIMSISPSDWRATKQATAHIRRRIRQWKAEAVASLATETAPAVSPTLEQETMDDSTEAAQRSTDMIDVLGRQITKVEYKGQRVVTLRQIDEAHERPDGTAGRQFRQHRERFAEGVDCFEVGADEIRRHLSDKMVGRTRGGTVFLLTERGYGKIVKGWNDDLSWQLHDAMQDAYFCVNAGGAIAQTDETSALLEVLADLQSAVVAAQQSGHATALEHIDGGKAAVLHYIKTYLKEPSQAFFDDARARNKAAYQRDAMLLKALRETTAEVAKLLHAARQPMLDRPFVWADWFDLSRIYSEFYADQVIPRRRFLSNQISRSLDSWCKRRRRHVDMDSREVGGRFVNFYHRDAVVAWLGDGGRAIIEAHLRKDSRQTTLQLVEGGRP